MSINMLIRFIENTYNKMSNNHPFIKMNQLEPRADMAYPHHLGLDGVRRGWIEDATTRPNAAPNGMRHSRRWPTTKGNTMKPPRPAERGLMVIASAGTTRQRGTDASAVPEESVIKPALVPIPRQRVCLRCEQAFASAWVGERICSRCKTTSAWRSSVPRQSGPGGRGR